jgi:small subunit ribosomal protein S8
MYTDLLTKVKNAQKAHKEVVKSAYSNFDFAIAEILAKNGFVESAAKKGRMPKRVMEIKLKYGADKVGAITNLRLLSTPGRRLYAGYQELRPVKQGYGLVVISTPKGLMTGKEARRAKLGGQLLFEIW